MSIPQQAAQISPEELHLLYILLDSNLPTGGFVSSSGLESYVKHGFLGHPSYSASNSKSDQNQETKEFSAVKGTKDIIRGVTDFAEAEVGHYANTTGCFVRDSWSLVNAFLSTHPQEEDDGGILRTILGKIEELDGYHESTLLSHVARRASKAQGVAMLTLFGRGLTRPVGFEPEQGEDEGQVGGEGDKEKKSKDLIDAYKLLVRRGSVPGHLAICWGIITAALGLALGKSNSLLPSSFVPSFQALMRWDAQKLMTRPINPPLPIPPRSIPPLNSSTNEHNRPIRIFSNVITSIQRYYRAGNREFERWYERNYHHWSDTRQGAYRAEWVLGVDEGS
jgi:hypothetical protein